MDYLTDSLFVFLERQVLFLVITSFSVNGLFGSFILNQILRQTVPGRSFCPQNLQMKGCMTLKVLGSLSRKGTRSVPHICVRFSCSQLVLWFLWSSQIAVFNMGSTVVLVFQAPVDGSPTADDSSSFSFCVKQGERVRVGQALGKWQHPWL